MRTLSVYLAPLIVLALAAPSQASLIFMSTFDSAVGTSDGDAISGVTGGTAAIRDAGTGSSEVVTSSSMGDGGFLRTTSEVGGNVQGATFDPAAAANNLNQLYSRPSGTIKLNGAIDFFFRSDNDIDALNELNAIDVDRANGSAKGLALNVRSTATRDFQLRVGYWDGAAQQFFSVLAPAAFQIAANNIYHLGFTLSTDAAGLTTARIFGLLGTGAIDTTSATNLLASTTFNLDETLVLVGFPTGNYVFGSRMAGSPKVQDFDTYRLFDADPGLFEGMPQPEGTPVPEPTTLGLLTLGLGGLVARRRTR